MKRCETIWYAIFLGCFLWSALGHSQPLTQRVTGTVKDQFTKQPLPGVSIVVLHSDPLLGTITGDDGSFAIDQVPVGRWQLQCSFVGYQTYTTEGLVVSSSKVVQVEIDMSEGLELESVEVVAAGFGNAPVNNLAMVSARSFTVEETERIAASVNDMGRMALSYPGVQQGGDDTENDIIIRGNSSMGILWRLEGIDIPNPNHFARPGTSGGGITIFSAQLLSRSDFYTGGMPAEYGNALSGAFDIHFKHGNLEDREYRAKAGLLGLDFATEGPIRKSRSSYVANYRYSTLGLLNKLGFHLVGERVSNDFQDLSFNLYGESADKKKQWTLFGMGGLSLEHYTPVENPEERDPGIANHWEDRIQGSNMATLGSTYTHLLNEHSYLKGVVAIMGSKIFRQYDTLSLADIPYRYNTEDYLDQRISTAWSYSNQFSERWSSKSGLITHLIFYNFYKESNPRSSITDVTENQRVVDLNGGGTTTTWQAYTQANWQVTPQWSILGGLHVLYLGLNQTASVDPRLSMRYVINPDHTLSLAIGKHSQMLPLAAYFYQELRGARPNANLPMIHSNHLIISHTYITRSHLKFNTELYYQQLRKVPVKPDENSDYWMLNDQANFPEFAVVSKGKGSNYGIDLAVEKFFTNRIYFLFNGSLFNSNYQAFDGTIHPTRFASKWVSALTLGREFSFKNGNTLQAGGRYLFNGGFRYTPYDPLLSELQGTYVALQGASWEGQVPAYQRLDARISYRFNRQKYSGILSLDIQNVLSKKNINSVGYDAVRNYLYYRQYPGGDFIPVLSYQVDF
ncbi:MAG: TonB-dependent receptor [Saprospiraceae bacterium]